MKTAAIVGEFNPFHNGHKLIIEKARQLGADRVIVLMSGDYVQRGVPAITDRMVRTHMALLGGADAVLAYPTRFSSSSAEAFASHAIDYFNHLGCVDELIFGSECGDLEKMEACADVLAFETPDYKERLHAELRKGVSFPKARASALPEFAELLETPNNILGIEYLKALKRTGSAVKPQTVKREGAAYLDENSLIPLSSAAAVRHALSRGSGFPGLEQAIPADAFEILKKDVGTYGIVRAKDLSLLLIDRLWKLGDPELLALFEDVTPELANTIINKRNLFLNFEDFAVRCSSKCLTVSHVSRALLHIALGIRKDPALDDVRLTRVLGFRKEVAGLIAAIQKNADFRVIMNPAQERRQMDGAEGRLFDEELRVSNLYESIRSQKSGLAIRNSLTKEIIKI